MNIGGYKGWNIWTLDSYKLELWKLRIARLMHLDELLSRQMLCAEILKQTLLLKSNRRLQQYLLVIS